MKASDTTAHLASAHSSSARSSPGYPASGYDDFFRQDPRDAGARQTPALPPVIPWPLLWVAISVMLGILLAVTLQPSPRSLTVSLLVISPMIVVLLLLAHKWSKSPVSRSLRAVSQETGDSPTAGGSAVSCHEHDDEQAERGGSSDASNVTSAGTSADSSADTSAGTSAGTSADTSAGTSIGTSAGPSGGISTDTPTDPSAEISAPHSMDWDPDGSSRRRLRRCRRLQVVIFMLLCLGFCLASAQRTVLRWFHVPANHVARLARDDGRLITLTGTIASSPYITRTRGALADYDFLHSPRTVFDLKVESVLTPHGHIPVGGTLGVLLDDPHLLLQLGQRVELDGTLLAMESKGGDRVGQASSTDTAADTAADTAPNTAADTTAGTASDTTERTKDDSRASPHRDAAFPTLPRFAGPYDHLLVRVPANEAVRVIAQPGLTDMPLQRLRARLRHHAEAVLLREPIPAAHDRGNSPSTADLTHPVHHARGLIAALLLGQRYQLDQSTTERFVANGTIHFLSVSGLHVGLIAAFAWLLARLCRLERIATALLVLGCVGFFILIVPTRPPILRAGIITFAMVLALLSRRRRCLLSTLAFAGAVILLWRPEELFRGGFQLSFITVLGLISFVGPLYQAVFDQHEIERRILAVDTPTPWQRLRHRLLQYITGLLLVSIVAWSVSVPLVAWHYHRVAVWGWLGSALMLPLISLSLGVGFLKLLLGLVAEFLALPLTLPLDVLAAGALRLNEWLAVLPIATMNTASPPFWLLLMYYGLLIVAAVLFHARPWGLDITRHPHRLVKGTAVTIITAGALFLWAMPFRPSADSLRMSVMDVGWGCSCLVELPDNSGDLLYDAGSLSRFNVANETIIPYLRSRGIQRLDAVFISHANLDHFSGLVDLCRLFEVKAVYVNPVFADPCSSSRYSAEATCLAMLAQSGTPVYRIDRVRGLARPQPVTSTTVVPARTVATLSPHATDTAALAGPSSSVPPEITNTLTVLFPPGKPLCELWEANDTSLVLKITTDHGSVLLTGDNERDSLDWLMANTPAATVETNTTTAANQPISPTPSSPRDSLQSDVLLLPHHGSVTHPESLRRFVDTVDPCRILISSRRQALQRREQLADILPDRRIHYTAEHGTLLVELTQHAITVTAVPSPY